MKRNYLLMIALIAMTVFVAGCSKEESFTIEDSNELKITTSLLKPSIKSMVSSFTNSTIGVYVDDDNDLYNPTTNSIATVSTGDNYVTVDPSISITADATVYSWYPTTTSETVPELSSPNSTSTTNITVVNADDFSATNQTDYLWATPVDVTETNRTATLTFQHALSKVIFSIKKSDDFSDSGLLSKISISSTETPFLSGSGTMTIADGNISDLTATSTLTYTDETNPITLTTDAQEAIALLAPTTLAESTSATSTITITLTIDGTSYPATFPVSKVSAWEAGNAYTYNITVNKKELEISTVLITDWESNTTTTDLTLKIPETANCYIIAPDNSLEIPVNVRGNGVEVASTKISATISPSSVGILWQTSPDLISLSDMTCDEKVTITANSTSGNAVIAAYDGENQTGNILWSWHIWVTDYDPDNGTTYTITNSSGDSYTFMDRNLGATTATAGQVSTLGLIYQWGRKDPFPGSASTTDNTEPTIYDASGTGSTGMITTESTSELDNAIKNPLTFYIGSDWCSTPNDAFWGGALISSPTVKTMFDPSPAGWRIPTWKSSVSPWSEFSTDNFTWSDTDHGQTYSDGPFYPAAGYRDNSSGALRFVGSHGDYWSGSPNSSYGYGLYFLSSLVNPANDDDRAYGFSIRCVKDE